MSTTFEERKSQRAPQRPLGVKGRLGRKKQKARGERVPRARSIFSIVAFVIGIPRSLCGGKSVYLCKRGGGGEGVIHMLALRKN